VAFLGQGGSGETARETLRQMGFVRLPGELLASLDVSLLAAEVAAALGRPAADIQALLAALASPRPGAVARADESLVDGLGLSLAGAVVAARERREVRDPTITDLIARELLDFPRHLCSLGTWLRIERVAAALANPAARRLATHAAVEAATAFARAGRELYR
jgi:hypothetical protein